MTHLTADDLAALADEAGVTRLQVDRMERAGFLVIGPSLRCEISAGPPVSFNCLNPSSPGVSFSAMNIAPTDSLATASQWSNATSPPYG